MPDALDRSTRVRVLHIITSLGYGGAERLVVSAARGLPGDRFESAVCCLSGRGPLAAEAEAAGAHVHCVGDFPGFSNPAAFARLMGVIRAVRPAIVHTHLQSPNLYGRLAALLCRVPVIVATEHNVYTAKARRYIAVERRLARFTDALVAVSGEVQQFLAAQIGVPLARIHVIRNGAGVPASSPAAVDALRRRALGGTPDGFCVATVASLTSKKGHAVLLRALAKLRERGIRCVALLAGDGPERARLVATVTDLHLNDAVVFLGAVSQVGDVLAAADGFVLPSLVEGLPLALLEAMHAGKAIVATAVGGVPEAVTDGVNGLLCESGDDAALADAIARLAASVELRATLGERARVSASERFSEAVYLTALAALYDELLRR